jgi:hypothetical protein
MADRRTLGIVGFFFCGVTAAVMLIGAVVVKNYVESRQTVDSARQPVIAASAQIVVR